MSFISMEFNADDMEIRELLLILGWPLDREADGRRGRHWHGHAGLS